MRILLVPFNLQLSKIQSIQKIKWENFLDAEGTFAIGAVVNSKNFTSNSHYISLKSKDAIADYFRHKS